MQIEPDLFARTWAYILETGAYWWAGLAVLLAIERIAERMFPVFWRVRVDPHLSPNARRGLLVLFAVIAFLYGNFRAFDDQAARLRKDDSLLGDLKRDLSSSRALADERLKEIDKLSAQVAALQKRLDELSGHNTLQDARNPDGLYQLNELVATVTGMNVDRGHSRITFQAVRSAGNLDTNREVEYRNFVLKCPQLAGAPPLNTTVGMFIGMTAGATCEIAGVRQTR
jgi:hypothetical protein